ncbi:MAG: hypothetical protein ACW96U_00955 [Candidatus Heimdallarchaeaceae archaeon]|jgi:hypothetical protein
MDSYTWADFKKEIESHGIKDKDEIWFIDINKKECELSIVVEKSTVEMDGADNGWFITNYPDL